MEEGLTLRSSFLLTLLLLASSVLAQDAGEERESCLILDGQPMHEFGSELAYVHAALAECQPSVETLGGQAEVVVELDGEEYQRFGYKAETVRVTAPVLNAGPHEFVVSVRSLEGEIVDDTVYTFFTADFKPNVTWMFPPDDYVFKRNAQRFLRWSVSDIGDPERCQEGAASCEPASAMLYHVNWYSNGQLVRSSMQNIYMVPLIGLPENEWHESTVEFLDKHQQPLGIKHTVKFMFDESQEYTEDGAGPEKETPCSTDDEDCRATGDQESCHLMLNCGDHGVLENGICVCEGDWTGDQCQHHLLSQLTYLPEVDPQTSVYRCGQARELNKAAEELRIRIDAMQHLQDSSQCVNASRISPVRLRKTNGHAGMASFFEQVAGALGGALKNGTMLFLRDFGDYFFHRACPSRSLFSDDLSCYLQPLFSGCQGILNEETLVSAQLRETEVLEHYQHWKPLPEFQKFGYFWWNSWILHYIVAPNRRLQDMVRGAKAAMGWRHPIIGVHVRRGDSCNLKRSPGYGMPLAYCKTFNDFMPHIRKMSELYGVKTVFVTSDSTSVYEETKQFSDEFTIIYSRADREFLHHDWLLEMRLRMALVDRKQVADSTLIDTIMLSSCDYLILGLQSGYSRMALSLASAQKGYVPPYVSMDYPWMPRFGMTGPNQPWIQWWEDSEYLAPL